MKNKKKLNVVGAILVNDNEILCAQRGVGKYEYVSRKYEFPGGKIEKGESPEEALHRELIEEMLVDVPVDDMQYFDRVEYEYPDFILDMETFLCPVSNREITLTEHLDIKWLTPDQVGILDWAPADWPIVKALRKRGI